MAGHYGMSGDWWELPGDMNCDGRVDLADALIVGARFGNSLEQMGFLGVTGAGYTDTSKSAAPMGRPLVSVNSLENTDLQYSAPEASDGFDPLTTDLSIKPGTDSFEQASYRTAFDDEPETNRFDLEPPIDILQSALKNPLTLQGTGHSSVR